MTYFFEDKQQYFTYQEAFRQLSRGKLATSEDHILYNFIRNRDLKCGFSPLVNPKKIDPYTKDEWRGFNDALRSLNYSLADRAYLKDRYEKYGKNREDAIVPLTLRYGETITEELWTKITEAFK